MSSAGCGLQRDVSSEFCNQISTSKDKYFQTLQRIEFIWNTKFLFEVRKYIQYGILDIMMLYVRLRMTLSITN